MKKTKIWIHECITCSGGFICDKINDKCICFSRLILISNIFATMYFCSGYCYKSLLDKMDIIVESYSKDDIIDIIDFVYEDTDFDSQYEYHELPLIQLFKRI